MTELYLGHCSLQAAKIDRKLKLCHNLLLDPDSDAFEQQDALKQQQAQKQRQAKVRGAWHPSVSCHKLEHVLLLQTVALMAAQQAKEAQLLGEGAAPAKRQRVEVKP